ncbi:hypothetical protein GCM10027614_81870 [Micromonospora vulcania]
MSGVLGCGDDQAAATQTRQVVGQVLPAGAQQFGEVGRVARAVPQREQEAGPDRIGQGVTEAGQDLAVRERLHRLTVHQMLNKRSAELILRVKRAGRGR